jgi:hypothetical protein
MKDHQGKPMFYKNRNKISRQEKTSHLMYQIPTITSEENIQISEAGYKKQWNALLHEHAFRLDYKRSLHIFIIIKGSGNQQYMTTFSSVRITKRQIGQRVLT